MQVYRSRFFNRRMFQRYLLADGQTGPFTRIGRQSGIAGEADGVGQTVIVGSQSTRIIVERNRYAWAASPGGGGDDCDCPIPTGLTVDSSNVGVIDFSWSYGADPDLDFVLEWSTESDFSGATEVTGINKSLRSSSVDTEEPGITHYIRIKARNSGSCQSAFTAGVEAVDSCEAAVAVSNFSPSANRGIENNSYTVTAIWDEHPDPSIVARFALQRADLIGGPYADVNSDDQNPFLTILADFGNSAEGAVLPNTTYFYRLQTQFNNGCPDAFTDPVQVDSGCHVADINPSVDGITQDSAIIHFGVLTAIPLQEYVVNWGTTPGGPYPDGAGDIPQGDALYEIQGSLNPDTTYYFRVRALDSETCFFTSSEGTFTTEPE